MKLLSLVVIGVVVAAVLGLPEPHRRRGGYSSYGHRGVKVGHGRRQLGHHGGKRVIDLNPYGVAGHAHVNKKGSIKIHGDHHVGFGSGKGSNFGHHGSSKGFGHHGSSKGFGHHGSGKHHGYGK